MRVLQLLTMKPLTYAANVGEGDLMDSGQSNTQVQALKKKALEENCEVVVVSAQVEPDAYAVPSPHLYLSLLRVHTIGNGVP